MKDKYIEIIKGFKLVEKTSERPWETSRYSNKCFPDYSIVSKCDGFHQTEYELYRKDKKIYSQTGFSKSLNFIAEVILRDVECHQPFWILSEEKNPVIYHCFDKKSDEFLNGDKKQVLKKGYYVKTKKINEDEFKFVYFNIDVDGNPTVEFSEEDYERLNKKLIDEYEKTQNEINKRWNSWKKRYLKE